jgi:hypothetical protein
MGKEAGRNVAAPRYRFVIGSKFGTFSFAKSGTRQVGRREMAEPPVVTGREARAGSKEGVVRYVLLASLVLVVVLFTVAYELFY